MSDGGDAGRPDPARVAVLRERLAVVRGRIEAAARAAGRDPAGLTLIAVSKTRPASDVVAMAMLGVRDFAENREQEAGPKVEAVHAALGVVADTPWPAAPEGRGLSDISHPIRPSGLLRDTPETWRASRARGVVSPGSGAPFDLPVWHFVGQLQRNKARAVAGWAHYVHSVDRASLVGALSRAAVAGGRTIAVCIQVSLDLDGGMGPSGRESVENPLHANGNVGATGAVVGGRGGARPADVPALADLVAAAEGLRLAGLMAVAPRGVPARPAFAQLRHVAARVRCDHPAATMVSAGMSGDLEDAVAEGATHLRIGTALFGERHGVP